MVEYIEPDIHNKRYVKRINFKMDRSMYCTYSGECAVDSIIHKDGICNFCIWRKKMDIPKILEEVGNVG